MKRHSIAHGAKRKAQRTPSKLPAGRQNTEHATRNTQLGFTLVELLIAIAITAFALAGVYTSFVVQQRSFSTQDQVAEVNLTSKIAFDMIINDIRAAGFGYPDGEDINGQTGAITMNDGTGPNGSDTITFVGGLRQLATLKDSESLEDNQIDISGYLGSTEFNCDSSLDTSCPTENSTRSALSIDGVFFARIKNCTVNANGNCKTSEALTLDTDLNTKLRTSSSGDHYDRPVYLVEDVTYQIDNDNNLNRGSETIAENIEDLQFAYAVDTNDDGIADDYRFESSGDSLQAGDEIIRVRANLLARTAHEDSAIAPGTKPYSTTGITLEGNTTTVNTDRYRRRIWSMEVGLRN